MNKFKQFTHHHFTPLFVMMFVLEILLDRLARKFSLYFILPHFDKILHTFGGATVGVFAIILIEIFYKKVSNLHRFLFVVGCALLVGVGVEVGEYVSNLFLVHPLPFDRMDTFTDILCDILGGVLSGLYGNFIASSF